MSSQLQDSLTELAAVAIGGGLGSLAQKGAP